MSGVFANLASGLVEMAEQPYRAEHILQRLVEQHPALIPGDQIDQANPRRWLLVKREMPVAFEEGGPNRWSLDHLMIDQDDMPTLIETKRGDDPRVRREVIGQHLDYAASAATLWSADDLRELFEERCAAGGQEPESTIAASLGDDLNPEELWASVASNLASGRLRILFVSDRIPAELIRVIEFLNNQMTQTEVLGVEIRQFIHSDELVFVSRVIGQTAIAQETKGKRQWDEESWFAELERRCGSEDVVVARRLFDWARRRELRISFGQGKTMGSWFPLLDYGDDRHFWPIAVWTYGSVELQFQHMKDNPPFDSEDGRRELASRISEAVGVDLPSDRLSARPSFPLDRLRSAERLEAFLVQLDWALEEVRRAHGAR